MWKPILVVRRGDRRSRIVCWIKGHRWQASDERLYCNRCWRIEERVSGDQAVKLELFRGGVWIEPEWIREFDFNVAIGRRPTVTVAGQSIAAPWRILRNGEIVAWGDVTAEDQPAA